MKRVISLLLILPLAAGVAATPLRVFAQGQTQTEDPPISTDMAITEVKLGGPEPTVDASKQYVSLFNKSDTDINLNSWRLEYAKASFDPQDCSAEEWASPGTKTSKVFEDDVVPAGGVLSLPFQLTDNQPGVLRIIEPAQDEIIVHDLVGWTNEGETAPCTEGASALTPPYGESIHRYLDCENAQPVDTDDNLADFFVSQDPSYSKLSGKLLESCEADEDPEPEEPTLTCEGIKISEILPNAAGSDTGKEFIELYNPTTDYVLLDGCGLAINDGEIYWFEDDIELATEQYIAFYDSQTGLVLPNAAGGTVYLLSPDEEELDEVTYAPGLDDDVSWAWVEDGLWEQTYAPTPDAINTRQPTKPCPEGQVRSEETGRCRAVDSNESTLKPCAEGQERNPATNRCRKVNSGSGLKPCAPDQERNPATNRCRKIGGTSDLKPCKPDQERNPETNRCRKVAGANTGAIPDVHDIQTTPEGNTYRWWIAGAAIATVLAYGIFEWRRDIAALWRKYTSKTDK